jgi:hypothetical protein
VRTTILSVFIATVALVGASAALAGSENGNTLSCFSGTQDGGANGTCTLTADGAVLDNVDGDTNPFNNYSGVYLQNSNLDGKALGSVNKLSFRYTGDPTAGSPRFSLPIDTGSGTTAFYAFVSAFYCNDGNGLVDALNDATCTIQAGSESFPNWAAMLAAHPDWRVGPDLPFVIADDPGTWTVSDVQLGKGPAKGSK